MATRKQYLTTPQAAKALGIDPSTLWRWYEAGLVTPSSRLLGGPRRRGRLYFTPARVEEIRQQLYPVAATTPTTSNGVESE